VGRGRHAQRRLIINTVGMAQAPESIALDVWADIACPWCFIGLRHLERALADREDVRVRSRAYELQPTLPAEGIDRAGYFERLFGSAEAAASASAAVVAAAEGTGIAFDLDGMPKIANTFFAHRVVAAHHDDAAAQQAVLAALFSLYFEQAGDLGDADLVLAVASAASGRSVDLIGADLAADGDGSSVLADRAEARTLGIQAVPTFVAGGRLAVQGAQPPEVLRALLDRVAGGTPPAS
jgi:predicted DsbA family dithiol-disulfide isomerase